MFLFAGLSFIFLPDTSAIAQGKGKGKGQVKEKTKGGPPSWAPAHGYRAKTRHVFFKEYNVYYDLQKSVYISLSGSNWQVSAELPVRLANVNLSAAVQVEIDLDADDPQRYYKTHIR